MTEMTMRPSLRDRSWSLRTTSRSERGSSPDVTSSQRRRVGSVTSSMARPSRRF